MFLVVPSLVAARYLAQHSTCERLVYVDKILAGRPCGYCDACAECATDNHPDVAVLTPMPGMLRYALAGCGQHLPSISFLRTLIVPDIDRLCLADLIGLERFLHYLPSHVMVIGIAERRTAVLPVILSYAAPDTGAHS